jgi:hypothetical protein
MDDPRTIWQDQEVEEMKLSLDELHSKANRFKTRIWRRNLREFLASVVVVLCFGWSLWSTPAVVVRIADALVIAGALFYAWYLWKWGTPKSLPADLGRTDSVQFYRGELQRQRDLLRSVWAWALGPLVPGLALGFAYEIATAAPAKRLFHIALVAASAAFLAFVGWLNWRAARRLDRRIAEISREPTAQP